MANNPVYNIGDIEQYIEYFENQLRGITSLTLIEQLNVPAVSIPMYKKLHIVSMIDTWGRARFPKIKRNNKRFIRTIKECSGWDDCQRISLPQMAITLQCTSNKISSSFKTTAESMLIKWDYGHIYRINEVDPTENEIINLAETEEDKKIARKIFKKAMHANLFYTYRNHLVHEFREPGYGIDFSNDDSSPYYHGMDSLDGESSWELVYPLGFFIAIACSILKNLKKHLIDNDMNPYYFYEFGSLWK